jgi:hypothetical protein
MSRIAPADIHLSIAESIEAAVAIGTGILAWATWRMASATKTMAGSAKKQMELLERQTKAAEEANAHTKRQAAATSTPRLVVVRVDGDEIVGGFTEDDENRWTLLLRNDGLAPAAVREAGVFAPGGLVHLKQVPPGPINPEEKRLFETETSPERMFEGSGMIDIRYSGPIEDVLRMTVRVGKTSAGQWVVTEPERYT